MAEQPNAEFPDSLPFPWAQEAVRVFEEAVRRWKDARVVWGYRDRQIADRERSKRPDYQWQGGLLSWCGGDVGAPK
jgi:hypothetical protein